MSEKWYNRKERVWTERRQQMNFQQLSNLQYWTSLFSSPWSIAINAVSYTHLTLPTILRV